MYYDKERYDKKIIMDAFVDTGGYHLPMADQLEKPLGWRCAKYLGYLIDCQCKFKGAGDPAEQGRFFRSRKDIQKDTAIPKVSQVRYDKRLKELGLLTVDLELIPHHFNQKCNYFFVNLDAVARFIRKNAAKEEPSAEEAPAAATEPLEVEDDPFEGLDDDTAVPLFVHKGEGAA